MGTMLEKVHRMNVLLQKSAAESIDFKEMCELLSETLRANVYVVSKSGKILGYGMAEYALTAEWERIMNVDGRFPGEFNDTLLSFSETAVNLQNKEKLYVFSEEENETFRQKNITIVPVVGGGERLGTMLLARLDRKFTDEDIILAEYAATIVAMEILRAKQIQRQEETRKRMMAQLAFDNLSYSEVQAVMSIMNALKGDDGVIVASRVADEGGITRSVVVNAVRKLQSAGLVDSRSLGMKGTYLRILNPFLRDVLKKAVV
ncbi:MAG: GTP-sensing pleiotropic transcriptional regulator CodY [Kyrpidia sp.]|nr:GTP-sensing pleiotropic transcriptional regulator CodY [Kyrpidia sp.]